MAPSATPATKRQRTGSKPSDTGAPRTLIIDVLTPVCMALAFTGAGGTLATIMQTSKAAHAIAGRELYDQLLITQDSLLPILRGVDLRRLTADGSYNSTRPPAAYAYPNAASHARKLTLLGHTHTLVIDSFPPDEDMQAVFDVENGDLDPAAYVTDDQLFAALTDGELTPRAAARAWANLKKSLGHDARVVLFPALTTLRITAHGFADIAIPLYHDSTRGEGNGYLPLLKVITDSTDKLEHVCIAYPTGDAAETMLDAIGVDDEDDEDESDRVLGHDGVLHYLAPGREGGLKFANLSLHGYIHAVPENEEELEEDDDDFPVKPRMPAVQHIDVWAPPMPHLTEEEQVDWWITTARYLAMYDPGNKSEPGPEVVELVNVPEEFMERILAGVAEGMPRGMALAKIGGPTADGICEVCEKGPVEEEGGDDGDEGEDDDEDEDED